MIQGHVETKAVYTSSFDLIGRVLKTEGIGGFYRGYVLQQFTYAPFNGTHMLCAPLRVANMRVFVSACRVALQRVQAHVPERHGAVRDDV
jgi:hypothetical protein